MTLEEFSNEFDVRASSYRRFRDFDKAEAADTYEFNEYEKSVWLTKSQEGLVVSLYSGKNPYGQSFERTEELRRYLDGLVKTKVYSSSDKISGTGVSGKSVFFQLPDDLAFITFEQVKYDDSSVCYDGEEAYVRPVTQDEYSRIKNNPFSGATRYHVLRLDAGKNVAELVSNNTIGTYTIRYMAKPTPIVLEDLPEGLSIEGISKATECALNPMLHNLILDSAVQMALASKGIRINNN